MCVMSLCGCESVMSTISVMYLGLWVFFFETVISSIIFDVSEFECFITLV